MAPTNQKRKNDEPQVKDGNFRKERKASGGVNKKKKWIPHNKIFEGSVKEGQGFAFKKKEKVRHEYNKLLRRERKKNPKANVVYKEEYPEHLKHLYLAEAEQLRKQAWENRVNRSKLRMKGQMKDGPESNADVPDTDLPGGSELMDSASGNPEPTTSEQESFPISNRMRKKMQRKTSYQKTKEEFENVQEKRRLKKEAYLKNKQQREEAIQRYKQKKVETFRLLRQKTKKGQPNLNVQMDYLLQKIQGTDK
ncbi:thyroid transcription factor 1-associated protein 26 homolog [Gambusia affinis]|uniref:thyroid transcription factor 1-associated protein 26 homolog n=1 Tax=Gambusia affinis TaxID=33528 RepID=UPI001CDCB81B|nr:thyroid transcription factor 1-associated protein 26 homolog [Gambusia affinis]XP_043963628.1 thyroid transcription factor 1-associated protein 26 homolog [Gambusia affinis]